MLLEAADHETYVVVLSLLPLLEVVLLCLESDDGIPELAGLGHEVIVGHAVEVEGLDADGERDLLFLLELLLGLGHLAAGILNAGNLNEKKIIIF